MTLPDGSPLPEPAEDPARLAARRRRRRRFSVPGNAAERAELLTELVQRVTPPFDFYLFTLFAGVALAVAIMTDSRAFFVLTALIAPFMAPVVGVAFSSVLGSGRLLAQMLGATFLGGLVIFSWGALTGWLARFWPGLAFDQAAAHARFTWPDVLVLLLGAGVTVYALVRAPQQRPLVGSVALAYELYLPLGVSGFGLTSNQAGLWPQGLWIFALHFFLAALTGALVLAALRIRPLGAMGYVYAALLAALAFGAWVGVSALTPAAVPQPAITPTSPTVGTDTQPQNAAPLQSVLPSSHTPTVTTSSTVTPVPTASTTRTPTNTLLPTRIPSATITPRPTEVWAYINASVGGGVVLHKTPSFSGAQITTISNGILVEVLPDMVEAENVIWVKIRMDDGREGWTVRSLLVTATPSPGW